MARDQGRYQIVDEPSAGSLAAMAMHPFIPFLVFMIMPMAGTALFVFNALALKGQTWVREIVLAIVAGLLRFAIPASFVVWLIEQGLPERALPYLSILPLAIALWLGYRVFHDQSITHQIRSYFSAPEVRS